MVKVVCVLRSGGDFNVQDVVWLQRQIERHAGEPLYCLSDVELPHPIRRIPLNYDWPGWWARAELFRPDIDGDIFYLDLDTVILRDIRPMVKVGKSTMLKDFLNWTPAAGLMYVEEKDRAALWAAWMEDPARYLQGKRMDHEFFLHQPFAQRAGRWQKLFPGWVISFKVHMRRPGVCHLENPPDDARVVCFHGKPRPSSLNEQWLLDARAVHVPCTAENV